jgi:glycolate oxidase FAD binding subunit
MLHEAAARELAQVAGANALSRHEPVRVDGAAIEATLAPADGAALAESLAALGRLGLSAVVRGAGSRLALGNPPRGADLFLSTRRLAGVDVLEPGEGVCHAGAGTPLSELRGRARAQGFEVPLDPPEPEATLGGTLASAAVGPRCTGFGPPRDHVLGLEVALATGERTRCGGRVVKNVTGYDLNKLYTGSLGTLGVIEGVWLRLRPLPEATRVLAAQLPELGPALAAGLEAARCASARACALLSETAGGFRLVAELAGDAPAVERDAERLAAGCGAAPAAQGALAELRARQCSTPEADAVGAAPGTHGLRVRISARASRLAAAAQILLAAGARLLVHPGLGLVYAGFAVREAEGPGVFAAVRAAARAAGGSRVLEAGPAWAKRSGDVFGEPDAAGALARSLKLRFDPRGVLNPGRFQGLL